MATTTNGIYYRTNAEALATSEAQALSLANSVNNAVGLIPVAPSSLGVDAGSASATSIGKITFSGVTTLQVNSVFSSKYLNYRFFMDITATTTANNFNWRLRSGTTDYTTANYYGWGWYLDYNSGGYDTGQSVIATTTGKFGYAYGGTGTYLVGDILNPYLSTKPTGILNHQLNGGTMWWRGGFYNNNVSGDGITLLFPNPHSGTISFYGYNS